jgi:hypothetical protein
MSELLEAAIREHLELKRQRGADPGEVARLEREALGPPPAAAAPQGSQDPEAQAAAGAGPAASTEPSAAQADEEELTWEDAPRRPDAREAALGDTQSFDPFAEEHELGAEEAGHSEPHAPGAAPVPPAEPAPPVSPAESGTPAEHATPAVPAESAPTDSAPTEVHRPPGASDDWLEEQQKPDQPEQDPEDPDLLEKTPEFLEETPEHDRLWFEQKPPSDFDFDK